MESPKNETPKLPDMVKLKLRRMCGDHPSVTKTELNVKEEEKEVKDKERMSASLAKLTATSSRSDRPTFAPEMRARTMSEHALRALEARRRALAADALRPDDPGHANRALIQAALGSFRWPPYLVCMWVLVLLASHLLHCFVGILERSLPTIHKLCLYFRAWTEESWRSAADGSSRLCPAALALGTALLYALHCALSALHAAALWAVEPLCADVDERASTFDVPKITNYVDEIHSKTNVAIKC